MAAESNPDNADDPFDSLQNVTLKLVSNCTRDQVYTLMVLGGNQAKLLIVCRLQPGDNHLEAYDMSGREFFAATNIVPLGAQTSKASSLSSCIGCIRTYTKQGVLNMLASRHGTLVVHMYVTDPTIGKSNNGSRQKSHNIYCAHTGASKAIISHETKESQLNIFMESNALWLDQKKLIILLAVQLFFSVHEIHKLLCPDALITAIKCYSCSSRSCPSYYSIGESEEFSQLVPNMFALRAVGFNQNQKFQYFEGLNIANNKRTFTMECQLDYGSPSQTGKAHLVDKNGKVRYMITQLKCNDDTPLLVYNAGSIITGRYRSKMFFDIDDNPLYNLKIKNVTPSYTTRWGESTQYYVEPDIAMITRYQCSVGVCFKTENVPELVRVLVAAFALRAAFMEYKFDQLPMPMLLYYYKMDEICQTCQLPKKSLF